MTLIKAACHAPAVPSTHAAYNPGFPRAVVDTGLRDETTILGWDVPFPRDFRSTYFWVREKKVRKESLPEGRQCSACYCCD